MAWRLAAAQPVGIDRYRTRASFPKQYVVACGCFPLGSQRTTINSTMLPFC